MEAFDELAADMDAWKLGGMPPEQAQMHHDIVSAVEAAGPELPLANEYLARKRERLKAQADAAHARIDGALDRVSPYLDGAPIYSSVLDRDGGPAPLDSKADLDSAIGSLLQALSEAHKLACRLEDPRRVRILEALSAMPGSESKP